MPRRKNKRVRRVSIKRNFGIILTELYEREEGGDIKGRKLAQKAENMVKKRT